MGQEEVRKERPTGTRAGVADERPTKPVGRVEPGKATQMLQLQRLAGNRAAGRTLGASQPAFSGYPSAAEWARTEREHRSSLAVQRLGNPVGEALRKHRHELGAAEQAYGGRAGGVVLQRNMTPEDAAKFKMAIKELQRKLIAALGGRLDAGIWKRDGIFGPSTEKAVKKFQAAETLPVTGIVDEETWKRIDSRNVGSSRGREEFGFRQQMTEEDATGGDLVTGGIAAFDWAKKEDAFDVNVGVKFSGAVAKTADVVTAIESVWNTFALEYKGAKLPGGKKRKPKNPRVDLRFNVGVAQAKPGAPTIAEDVTVFLFEPPHPNWAARGLASEEDKKSRSDMLNWNVKDPKLPTMAAHEFGHLIGLEDEYARRHDDMARVAGPVAANTDPTVVGAAATWATDLAKAKTSKDFEAVYAQVEDLDKVQGRLATVAQIHKVNQGTRMSIAYRDAAKTQRDVAEGRAKAAEGDLKAAQKAAAQSLLDLKAATTDLGVAQLALSKRPDTDATIKAALADAKAKTADLAKDAADAGTAGAKAALYATNVERSKSKAVATAHNWSGVATKQAQEAADAAVRAKNAADTVAASLKTATDAIAAVNLAHDKAGADARTAQKEAAAQARKDSIAANVASDAYNARRGEWALRARMGVGNAEARDEAMAKVSGTRDLTSAAQKNAIDASKAATKAVRDATRAATMAKSAGELATTVGTANSKEAGGYLAVADASAGVGAKSLPIASDYREGSHIDHLSTVLVPFLRAVDSTGFTTASVMGNFHLDPNAVRENSPALEHSHPLQARHVNRFAEYIMKYKPGDLWEPVKR